MDSSTKGVSNPEKQRDSRSFAEAGRGGMKAIHYIAFALCLFAVGVMVNLWTIIALKEGWR